MAETLSIPISESVLTLIAMNNEYGKIAAGLLRPEHFDEDYRNIARRIIGFHKKNGKAPGKEHLTDLFDDILSKSKPKRKKQYLFILDGIIHQAPGLNAQYVLSRISNFTRLQALKQAWHESADHIERAEEDSVAEVENIWHKTLKSRDTGVQPGIFLGDVSRAFGFLEHMDDHYLSGIPAFDRVGLAPTPGEMLLMIAPKGVGKSWWAIQNGKQCLLQGARVLHVTLEMPETQVLQRYYQTFFAIPKRKEEYSITKFKLDDLSRLIGFRQNSINPRVSLWDQDIRKYLKSKVESWGLKFNRLLVAGFASGSLSVPKLESFIDNIELVHKFIPNVLILDYPDLMHMPGDDLRVATSRTYIDLRGLLQRRNMAGVFPTQGNRKSWDSATVKGSMIAEDATKLMTADKAVIYSQTALEKERGLARLHAEKNRDDEDGFTVIISQNYKTGQFVLDSTRMQKSYFELLEKKNASS